MGIGKFFRALRNPKQTVERATRKRMIGLAIATLMGLAATAGYQTSPAFQDAVTQIIHSVLVAVEEAPAGPVEEAPTEE